jgi:hypothetical protein
MKRTRRNLQLAALGLVLAAPGWAIAQCVITGTNASSVQSDSGNGTYNCAVVSTANGTLRDVTGQVQYTIAANGRVTWLVPVGPNGAPLVDVDLVSVSSNSGKRCNYTYSAQASAGNSLSTPDGSAAKTVTFCADGKITQPPPPPPPDPISTVGNQCNASFNYTGTTGGQFDVAIGYTKQFQGGSNEGVAICAGPGQIECINECVPRDTPAGTNCSATPDGRLPLACAACEWEYPDPAGSSKDLKYCWFYENRVDLATQTFKPSPKKKGLNALIEVTTGSNCYTVTVGPLYGGRTYSYQQCN